MKLYENCFIAIRAEAASASLEKPIVLAWVPSMRGWTPYTLAEGKPEAFECMPDILLVGSGRWPYPLSEEGLGIMKTLARTLNSEVIDAHPTPVNLSAL